MGSTLGVQFKICVDGEEDESRTEQIEVPELWGLSDVYNALEQQFPRKGASYTLVHVEEEHEE